MDRSVTEVFRNTELFNKDEVLRSFNLTIEHIKTDEEKEYTEEMKAKKLELCYKFKKALEKCKLPILTEDFLAYQYDITGDGIELKMCSFSDIELDADGELSLMTVEEEHKLLSMKCDYLTVEQYAKMQNVSPITVRQWIRHGKLRYAKKNGYEWLIPSLENKPPRGYQHVTYIWEELNQEILDQFPFLSMCKSIFIYQDEKVKSKYICRLEKCISASNIDMELTRLEVEQLEFMLISSGQVQLGMIPVQYVPHIER